MQESLKPQLSETGAEKEKQQAEAERDRTLRKLEKAQEERRTVACHHYRKVESQPHNCHLNEN